MEIYIRKFEGVGGYVWGCISQKLAPLCRYSLHFTPIYSIFTQNVSFSVFVDCNRQYFVVSQTENFGNDLSFLGFPIS